jgi:hypothetical protein
VDWQIVTQDIRRETLRAAIASDICQLLGEELGGADVRHGLQYTPKRANMERISRRYGVNGVWLEPSLSKFLSAPTGWLE